MANYVQNGYFLWWIHEGCEDKHYEHIQARSGSLLLENGGESYYEGEEYVKAREEQMRWIKKIVGYPIKHSGYVKAFMLEE